MPTRSETDVIRGTKRTIATIVILVAFFMDLLDSTIVNVAIPTLQHNLHTSYEAVQWITAGYSLTYALFLINGGRLGDTFGYKRLFLIGVIGFTICSFLSGIAPTSNVLIIARCLQGSMAAIMVPQVLSTIQLLYSPKERDGISGLYGAIGGLASVLGPILGALLIEWNLFGLDWRTIFLINVLVGFIAVPIALKVLPTGKSSNPPSLDLVGSGLLIVAMFMIMYPLIQGRADGWPMWMFALMVGAVPILVGFAYLEHHRDQDRHALIATHLFRTRSFPVGLAINIVFFGALVSFLLTFTLYLQIGIFFPVLRSGLTTIPFSVGVGLSAGLAGSKLRPLIGRYVITLGSLFMGCGYWVVYWTAQRFGMLLTPWDMLPGLLLAGVGMGMVVAPLMPFILGNVPIRDAGSASGLISAFGQIGAAAGIAIIGLMFFNTLSSNAASSVTRVLPELQSQLTHAHVPLSEEPVILAGFRTCFTAAAANPGASSSPQCGIPSQFVSAPGSAVIGQAFTNAAKTALFYDFLDAFHVGSIAAIIALVMSAVLSLFLPEQVQFHAQVAVN